MKRDSTKGVVSGAISVIAATTAVTLVKNTTTNNGLAGMNNTTSVKTDFVGSGGGG